MRHWRVHRCTGASPHGAASDRECESGVRDAKWHYHRGMVPLLIVVIILFALGILGAVVKGLLWLTLIAVLLILASIAYGWFKLRSRRA